MKRITPRQRAELDAALHDYRVHFDLLSDAVTALADVKADISVIFDRWATAAAAHYEAQPPQWQESEAGHAFEEWRDLLREIANEIENDGPETPDEPEWLKSMDDLPDAPG